MTVHKWSHKSHTQQAGSSLALKKVFNKSVRGNRHSGQIWDLHANPRPPQKICPFIIHHVHLMLNNSIGNFFF